MSRPSIPYGRHEVSATDVEAVERVLRSAFLTQGPAVPRFEEAVAARCGAGHGVAVNSGTSALHLACLALGVGPGDRAWTSAVTFVASANCARYCGADVDFVDIDAESYTLSVPRLEEKLAAAERAGTLPKVVIPVHLCGRACDLAEIHALSRRYHFRVLEDAAHAMGGRYRGEPVGSGRFSDVTVFSFHPVKAITTGEGGMVLTNDSELAARIARLRSHGVTRNPSEMVEASHGPWYYEQVELGFNYRMTDIEAALGHSQLQRLESHVTERRRLAARYDELLADLPVETPRDRPEGGSAFHLYVVRLRRHAVAVSHRRVFERLRDAGVLVNLHYIPVYRHPYYARLGYWPEDFPEAERYYDEAITLPLYPGLREAQQDQVVRALREALRP